MKLNIPLILGRAEFEKMAATFANSSVQMATFQLVSDIKSIRFDDTLEHAYVELK